MIGQRIQRARKAAGLSLRELAQQINLSHAAIKKYEDELAKPTSETLLKLARALRVRVEFFFRSAHFELENIQYRIHENLPERTIEQITSQILDKIERRIELENLFPSIQKKSRYVKSIHNKISNLNDIEDFAEHIRSKWKLGFNPIPNLIDTLEDHAIRVFEIDNEQYPKFDGLSARVNDIPIIVLGLHWPGDRQRFTISHELAHLFLSDQLSPELDIEQCCNRFAGAFLLPRSALIEILGKHRKYIEPKELNLLKHEFGVSMACVLHRAEDLGIISHGLYNKIRIEFNNNGWDKREPGDQYPQEKTRVFEQMIFHALAEDYIGESKAAELMNISLEQLRSLRTMEVQDVVNN